MSTIEVRYQRVRGGHLPARSDRNVAQTFLATVARLGDGVALRDPAHGAELSWNQWRDRVAATAAGLAKLGVSKGDTVALLHSRCVRLLGLYAATRYASACGRRSLAHAALNRAQ
jgi:acyl-CoA synthetase (AMP-forming)/AMP-acid ligase II